MPYRQPDFYEKEDVSVEALDEAGGSDLPSRGKQLFILSCDKTVIGLIALADTPKASAREAIENLKTGD